MHLKPGQKVLDMGCGGLALHLAADIGVDVTGVTLSEEQYRLASGRARPASTAGSGSY